MGGELLTFDEALAELQMATHELRSLVAQGEIRAFRDEDMLKFRRTDILDLKKVRESQSGDLVIEPDEAGDATAAVAEAIGPEAPAPGKEVKAAKHETEETELLAGIGQGAAADFLGLDEAAMGESSDTAQTVVPTIEIADEDMIDDTARTVVPSVAASDTDVMGEDTELPTAPTLLAEDDEATDMATQEISTDEVGAAATAAAAAGEEPLRFQDTGTAELGITTDDIAAGATAGVTAPRRAQQYRAELAAAEPASPVFLALAIATFVILLFAAPIFYGMATDQAPDFGPYKMLLNLLSQKTVQ